MPHTILHDVPDADLVEVARKGSRPAFDALVERHAPHAWRLASLVLRNGPAAEDVLRDAILAAWRTLPAYAGDPPFGTWLDRTALTRALRLLERTGEARQTPTAGRAAAELALLPAQEIAARVLECRAKLPGSLRAVLVLLDGEGRAVPEVEVLLGTPQAALRQRLWRARFALWRCLTGRVEPTKGEAAAQDTLCAYLDGELGAAERAAFEKKLETQPALGALARDLGTLRQLVAEEETPPMPGALLGKIVGQLPAGESVPAPRPRRQRPADRRPLAERLAHGPALRVVAILAILAALVGGGWAVLRAQGGEGFWTRVRAAWPVAAGQAGDVAPTPPVADEEAPPPAPDEAAPQGRDEARPDETAPAEADAGTAAAASGPAATGSVATAPDGAPAAAVPQAQPVNPVPPAVPEPAPAIEPGAAPPAPVAPPGETAPADATRDDTARVTTTCTATWAMPGGPVGWSATPPENPARVLGGLAQQLGGKGLLLDGDTPRVRMTVPRARWEQLAAALRARGVAVDAQAPPPYADCASLVVALPPAL